MTRPNSDNVAWFLMGDLLRLSVNLEAHYESCAQDVKKLVLVIRVLLLLLSLSFLRD